MVHTCRAGYGEWVLSIKTQASPQPNKAAPSCSVRTGPLSSVQGGAEVRAGMASRQRCCSTGAANRNLGDTTSRHLSGETKKGRDSIGGSVTRQWRSAKG